ncbi:MAG: SWIM zinc finger family protein [Chloroflexota bacterium]
MQSSLIGKIEKANRYAQETNRITFQQFSVQFHGDNSDYTTSLQDNKWQCSCSFFRQWGLCSHTMAMEKVLGQMLPAEAMTTQGDAIR